MALPIMSGGAFAAARSLPSADNTKVQYVTNNPRAGMAWGSVQRRIYLASGTYIWHTTPTTACRRDIYLGTGWYTWTESLAPRNGYYDHYSQLDPDNPAWNTAELYCKWNLNVSNSYRWGSALLPQF
ncbi:hypothetical protein [Nonomuraea aurantiaca]|uniref:hypothetical protein n=1 Tax=Nonomuraea aurantiaca TaxID=2878562 RepID=UPI001CD98F89|nr:hypothetical protein [Nonomuraea aurantiaca]MCA2230458.1 hypothetical protein [Nonomuraea aurantiaca]